VDLSICDYETMRTLAQEIVNQYAEPLLRAFETGKSMEVYGVVNRAMPVILMANNNLLLNQLLLYCALNSTPVDIGEWLLGYIQSSDQF